MFLYPTLRIKIITSTNLAGRAARIASNLGDLSAVPPKYHKFMNIFSKVKAFALALYFLYNLQIKLENGEKPFIRTIYLLSTVEQEALKEFIHESLNTRFII